MEAECKLASQEKNPEKEVPNIITHPLIQSTPDIIPFLLHPFDELNYGKVGALVSLPLKPWNAKKH
jgi:hypothetical protein